MHCFCPLIIAADKGYNYGIRVVSGKMIESGTSFTAPYVVLVGNKAATEKIYLTKLGTDIEAGTYLDLLIETTASLGNIQVVVVGIEVGLPNPWFIQYTGVYNLCDDDIEENRFPCYHWIKADTSVTTTSKTGMCV